MTWERYFDNAHTMITEKQFQCLVDKFALKKNGASPFDAEKLDSSFHGSSHGEKASIAFILNVWNPGQEWKAGKFDAIDALSVWDACERRAFCDWAMDPWWP